MLNNYPVDIRSIGFEMEFSDDKRARGIIAHGALTNSKRPQSFIYGVYPTHLLSGMGAFVVDTTGKKYIDFICGLGTNLYGYQNHSLVEAGIKAERLGMNLSLSSKYEIETAEKIREYMICFDRLRFLKTGTEACHAALIIARAFTKRTKVLTHGYHGWTSEFISITPPSIGCPTTGNIDSLDIEKIDTDTAAVIIEPVITDYSDNRRDELHALRKKCDETGALLIFDETITALRFPELSVANHFAVKPDIMIFGKALGGGSSLACVAGRQDVMECDYFVSSTFAGELSGILKAKVIMEMAKMHKPIKTLWDFGLEFWNEFNQILEDIVQFVGYPTRGILVGDDLKKAIFMQEACKAGLLFGPSPFLNFCHIELKTQIHSILRDVAIKIKTQKPRLEGQMPVKTVIQKTREK